MKTLSRTAVFALVGALGFGCQLGVLHLLVGAGLAVSISTALAVLTAVAHNFLWHRGWTWRDRPASAGSPHGQFLRFVGLNGLVSLAGNVVITAGLAGSGLPVLAANAVAVVVCSLANFVLANRLVFAAASAVLLTAGAANAAVLEPRTLAGWQEYVKATEQRIVREEPNRSAGAPTADQWRRLRAGALLLSSRQTRRPDGAPVDVPDGAVHHWVGRVFLPGVALDELVGELQAPTSRRWLPAEVRSIRVVGIGGRPPRLHADRARQPRRCHLRDRARGAVLAASGWARHQPQRVSAHRRARRPRDTHGTPAARRRRFWVPVALERVLAVCAGGGRRVRGVRITRAEPERAVAAAAGRRANHRQGVARVAGKHARRSSSRVCHRLGRWGQTPGVTVGSDPSRFQQIQTRSKNYTDPAFPVVSRKRGSTTLSGSLFSYLRVADAPIRIWHPLCSTRAPGGLRCCGRSSCCCSCCGCWAW